MRFVSKYSTTSTIMRNRRRSNSDSIPTDLIPEVLSRLPVKSVARFRCVSKLWKSIIRSQDFTKLFNTMSSSNPRLLIAIKQGREWIFFSSPQSQNDYGKSSYLVVTADFITKFSEDCSSDRGKMQESNEYEVCDICNLSSGQYAILPPQHRKWFVSGLLGFDPIGKQYKVLVSNSRVDDESVYQILTLGTEKVRWREMKIPSYYCPENCSGICINGVLYYKAYNEIGCFDVRSEKFKFLAVNHNVLKCFQSLINYKGKLCGIKLEYGHDGGVPLKLRMWVLEDFDTGEWSTHVYTLSAENKAIKVNNDLFVVGVTALGEIVLAKKTANAYKPFYVFYFNPDSNTLLSVEIQGVSEGKYWFGSHRVYCFVDHVDDVNFDVMKTTYSREDNRVMRTVSMPKRRMVPIPGCSGYSSS